MIVMRVLITLELGKTQNQSLFIIFNRDISSLVLTVLNRSLLVRGKTTIISFALKSISSPDSIPLLLPRTTSVMASTKTRISLLGTEKKNIRRIAEVAKLGVCRRWSGLHYQLHFSFCKGKMTWQHARFPHIAPELSNCQEEELVEGTTENVMLCFHLPLTAHLLPHFLSLILVI